MCVSYYNLRNEGTRSSAFAVPNTVHVHTGASRRAFAAVRPARNKVADGRVECKTCAGSFVLRVVALLVGDGVEELLEER